MINHRYTILRPLGGGGSGEVFLAKDALHPETDIALKILHDIPDPNSPEELQFQTEVSVLTALRHPHLIRVYEFDRVLHCDDSRLQGRPFFTMEYIEGTDALSAALSADESNREPLVKSVLLQALSVLSYVHQQGVIHFDIKPQNLLILEKQASSWTLKLTDFGFARKEQPDDDVPVRGTLHYTAPELLRGNSSDHRVDLYSLGATFFHILEKKLPFDAADPVSLIKAVLTSEPEFSIAREEAGERLRSVVRKLMARDPSHRFATANDAAQTLRESNDGKAIFAPKPRFVAREAEQQVILECITSLSGKRSASAPLCICGPEGIGKTALLDRASSMARARGLRVYKSGPGNPESPLGAITPILKEISLVVKSLSSEGRALVAKYPALTWADPHDGANLVGSQTEEQKARDENCAKFLLECSHVFPFLIVADDMESLDESSLQVMRILSVSSTAGQVLLLGSETHGNLSRWSKENCKEVLLGELTCADVVELAGTVIESGETVRSIGTKLFQLYGGVPGVLTEALGVIAGLIRAGEYRPSEDTESVSDLEQLLPRDLDGFLESGFRRMLLEQQKLLSVVSCFEEPPMVDIVDSILPFQKAHVNSMIEQLVVLGHLHETAGQGRLAIRLKKLKRIAYNACAGEHKALHASIASAMQLQRETLSLGDREELGRQFELSGDITEASLSFESTGIDALQKHAYKQSTRLIQRAIELWEKNGDSERVTRLQEVLASAMLGASHYAEASELAEEVLLKQGTSTFALHRIAGLAQSRQGEYVRAREHFHLSPVQYAKRPLGEYVRAREHFLKALSCAHDDAHGLELNQELAGVEIGLGNFTSAEETLRAQLPAAEKIPQKKILAGIYTDLGIAAFHMGQFNESVHNFEEAIGVYKRLDQPARVADQLMNIGNAYNAKGNARMAIHHWSGALTLSKEHGAFNQQAQILNNLGIARYNLGEFGAAKNLYQEARTLFDRAGSTSGLAYSLTNLGEVLFAEGEYEEALNTWSRAAHTYKHITTPLGERRPRFR